MWEMVESMWQRAMAGPSHRTLGGAAQRAMAVTRAREATRVVMVGMVVVSPAPLIGTVMGVQVQGEPRCSGCLWMPCWL